MSDILLLSVSDLGVSGNLSEYAGKVTISGLLIVFAMLVLLVALIWVFGVIMSGSVNKNKTDKPVPKKEKPVKVENKKKADAVESAVVAASDEDEIIAAISAAVAMMYEGTGVKPVIRSIRPAFASRSAWKAAGIANNTRPF